MQFFAEALLVPVGQWDKAQSLDEFEAQHRTVAAEAEDGKEPRLTAPPKDPHDFQGKTR